MRIYLDQIGCRLNYSEMETLASRLRTAGHQTVSTPEQAHVIVFNTCAVTADAVRGSRKQVRHLHSANPTARIAVTGCWATLQPSEASLLPGVTLVADNGQKDLLHTLLEPWSAELDDLDDLARMQPYGNPFDAAVDLVSAHGPADRTDNYIPLTSLSAASAGSETPTNAVRPSRTRAFIKVQDGCNNKCTFCIVTVARGESRSRALASLVHEVQQLVAEGVQEAVLTGVHLGSYGRDLTNGQSTDLKELVNVLLTDTDIKRLRLSSLEPWELAEGFFDLWPRWPGRLCPHLHLPLQAGTDRQLRRMARRCTAASFRQLVRDARSAIPDLILTSDLIVGFPGESDADFAEGMAFVEEMRFAHAHIFPFSAREGTAAANFSEQLPTKVKKARLHQLHALVESTGRAERLRFVGQQRPVLWEGEGQPLTDQSGRLWSGLTDNYLRVMAVAPEHVDLHNVVTPVRLAELQGDILMAVVADA
ncbi:MAG: tRNA (N(6)-L-threonylcarbamoyladenosine(37)-C(2))-methylthiotransferase MtaB [Chloroflexi bacterium]|nr:tRNA (N(6)-L-threonylcarbamoyladenosine(37)-C(2))-methylthiotransferase MtaB [Chloroflexota bacterium]